MSLASDMARAAAPAAAAERAIYKAKIAFDSEMDLAEAVAQNKADLKNMPREALPESLRDLSARERQDKVREIIAQRGTIRGEIEKLALNRAKYIQRETKNASKDSFDSRLVESLKEQAARSGIAY